MPSQVGIKVLPCSVVSIVTHFQVAHAANGVTIGGGISNARVRGAIRNELRSGERPFIPPR